MENETSVSRHGKKRSKQRQGLSKKASERMAEKAYKEGKGPGDFSGSFSRYLYKVMVTKSFSTTIKVYGEHIYVFRDRRLVTVLNVPNEYKRLVKKKREDDE